MSQVRVRVVMCFYDLYVARHGYVQPLMTSRAVLNSLNSEEDLRPADPVDPGHFGRIRIWIRIQFEWSILVTPIGRKIQTNVILNVSPRDQVGSGKLDPRPA